MKFVSPGCHDELYKASRDVAAFTRRSHEPDFDKARFNLIAGHPVLFFATVDCLVSTVGSGRFTGSALLPTSAVVILISVCICIRHHHWLFGSKKFFLYLRF
jgi:hypothetical protein